MNGEKLASMVGEFVLGFPREIGSRLEGVEILVCDTPEIALAELNELLDTDDGTPAVDKIEADAKGVFFGEPQETEDEDGEGEHVVETLADGAIVLIASNIKDIEEATLVLLHEIGHALGLDEEEVKALGLGVSPTVQGAPDNGSTTPTDSNPV